MVGEINSVFCFCVGSLSTSGFDVQSVFTLSLQVLVVKGRSRVKLKSILYSFCISGLREEMCVVYIKHTFHNTLVTDDNTKRSLKITENQYDSDLMIVLFRICDFIVFILSFVSVLAHVFIQNRDLRFCHLIAKR